MKFDFSYEYDATTNIVHVKPKGVMHVADIEGYASALLEDESVQSGYIEVVDFSGLEDVIADAYSFIGVETIFKKLSEQKNFTGSVAIVPTDYIYGMIRMLTVSFQQVAPMLYIKSEDELPAAIEQLRS